MNPAKRDPTNKNGSEVGNDILEETDDAADQILENSKKAVDKIEDLD